ncbi:MAG: hypothetical protein ICCCNLDF_03630 [Planctomycetes bacterium]|nr:hypothetical protein [Planctomycetota bacterium]
MSRPTRYSEYFGVDLPLMLRRDEVAQLFNVATRTVARWTASSQLIARKLEPGSRGTVRYRLDDVEAFARGIPG